MFPGEQLDPSEDASGTVTGGTPHQAPQPSIAGAEANAVQSKIDELMNAHKMLTEKNDEQMKAAKVIEELRAKTM